MHSTPMRLNGKKANLYIVECMLRIISVGSKHAIYAKRLIGNPSQSTRERENSERQRPTEK